MIIIFKYNFKFIINIVCYYSFNDFWLKNFIIYQGITTIKLILKKTTPSIIYHFKQINIIVMDTTF
jgi:hypothetical protein